LKANRGLFAKKFYQLKQENASLRDRLRSEHQRNDSLVAKMGYERPAWTQPGLIDYF